jgi:hypothetical protein
MPHMQGRTVLNKATNFSLGAASVDETVIQARPLNVRPGGLADVLDIFDKARPRISICIAGGHEIETTGAFVFSIRGETEEEEEAELDRALRLLGDHGYETSRNTVYHGDIPDEAGELLKFIREEIPPQELVHEIFVGTPDPDTKLVLVQITTLSTGASSGAETGR